MLTETPVANRNPVRAFAQERIKPRLANFEQADGFPEAMFEEVAGLGLTGMTAPENEWDAGSDYVPHALALIEVATDGARSTTVFAFAQRCSFGKPMIEHQGVGFRPADEQVTGDQQ